MSYKFESKVWLYPGEQGAWHFVSVPKELSEKLSKKYQGLHRGWRSLPVLTRIGKTKWCTSIFFDRRNNCYILPIKASIRKKEGIYEDDNLNLSIRIGL